MAKQNGGRRMLPACCSRSQNSAMPQREFQEEDEDKVLLNITVELEDGAVNHIAMVEGDTAESVARRFCAEQGLPDDFIEPLTDHIVANIISISQQDRDISFYPKMQAKQPFSEEKDDQATQATESQRTLPGSPKSKRAQTPTTARRFSDRVLSHTSSSRAKHEAQKNWMEEGRKGCRNLPARFDLSDKAKAVYMRLYQGYLVQRKRHADLEKATVEGYRQKLSTAKTQISKNSIYLAARRERKAMQFENYGEMLYEEGIDRLIRMIHREQVGREEAESRELAGCTGSPEISKFARQLRTNPTRFWLRLGEPSKSVHEQVQEQRNEMFEAEFMECTFKPRVNSYERDANMPRTTMTRFKQLYLDADSRRARREQGQAWQDRKVYTFCPKINHHINPATGIKELPHEGSVVDRLLQYASKLTDKRQRLQQRTLDATGGQKPFIPHTGRSPKSKRQGVIWEALYNFQWLYNKKKRLHMDRDDSHKNALTKWGYVTYSSKKVLAKLKERKYHQIFDCLDEDGDGVVRMDTADLAKFDDSVVSDLTLVKHLAADQRLHFEDFVSVIKAAERRRPGWGSIAYCHRLIKGKRSTQTNDSVKKKRASPVRTRQFSSQLQWYKLLQADQERIALKLEAMRKDNQKAEMAHCTFSPRLLRKKGSRRRKKKRHRPPVPVDASVDVDAPVDKILEKDEQDVHGFIFRETHGQTQVKGAVAAASSSEPKPKEEEDNTPMGLLKSLKLMVDNSLDRR